MLVCGKLERILVSATYKCDFSVAGCLAQCEK